jgi:hypothetical protein
LGIHGHEWAIPGMAGKIIMQESFTGICNLSYTIGYKERAGLQALVQCETFGIMASHHAFKSDIHDGPLYQH